MMNFYHRFLPPCASILQPLNELLTHPKDKSAPIIWTELFTFNRTKETFTEATRLVHPKLDALTCLMTDASSTAFGAVFQQLVEGSWKLRLQSLSPLLSTLTPVVSPSSSVSRLHRSIHVINQICIGIANIPAALCLE